MEAYIKHIKPKVKHHEKHFYQYNHSIISLSLSDFAIKGSLASTTSVTHLFHFLIVLQVTSKPSGRSQQLMILASSSYILMAILLSHLNQIHELQLYTKRKPSMKASRICIIEISLKRIKIKIKIKP